METKTVFLDFLLDMNFTQSILTWMLSKYPGAQIRDFHSGASGADALFVFYNLLTLAVNATLIMANFYSEGNPIRKRYPTIMPDLRVFDRKNRMVLDIWNKYYQKNASPGKHLPLFMVADGNQDYTFCYCGVAIKKSDSIWAFSTFTDPLDSQSWIYLMAAIFFVGILAHSSWKRIYFDVTTALSPLLSNGVTTSRRSGLFVLWMFTSTIVATFYAGDMTSHVIKPSPIHTINTLAELVENNYTLIYTMQSAVDILNTTARSMIRTDKPGHINHQMESLQRLVSGARRLPTTVYANGFKGAEELALSHKTALIQYWSATFWMVSIASEKLKSANSKDGLHRQCFIGKELLRVPERFMTILPPNNMELIKARLRFNEFGITDLWMKEIEGLMHSRKVRERVKVKSPTKMIAKQSEHDEKPMTLRMEGEMVNVFLLWTICLGFCLVCFSCEY